MTTLTAKFDQLEHAVPMAVQGTVSQVRGLAVHVADLPVPVGASVHIMNGCGADVVGQVVGFSPRETIVMPMGTSNGIRRGDRVEVWRTAQTVATGDAMLGRVLGAHGTPIDGKGPIHDGILRPLQAPPLDPLDRAPIETPLATGVRAIDALISVGRGQRLGVFAPPGIGKSVLLGQMARHTAADVNVIALVGERGREVTEFIDKQLDEDARQRSVVICATSDESPLKRLHAALTGATVAEYFRDQGADVLFIMDSLTRVCHAQRQIGLSAGEPPTTKGYPPSVFALIPQILERGGRTRGGSITGFFSVLTEGDEMDDPIAEAARGVLDGHVLLRRKLANRGHWPAIDVVESVSRVFHDVTDRDHQAARAQVVRLVHLYEQVEDLLSVGAYVRGSQPDFDLAIDCKPQIDQLLQQGGNEKIERADFDRTARQLHALMEVIEGRRKEAATQALRSAHRPVSPAPQ